MDMLENEVNLTALRQDIYELIKNYMDIPIKDLNTKEFIKEFTDLLGRYNLVMPSNFALAETTARQLDPDFNIVSSSKPFLKKIVYKEFSAEELLKKGNVFLKNSIEMIEKLPRGLSGAIDRIASGKIKFDFNNKDIRRITSEIGRLAKIIALSVIFASIIIRSSFIMLIDRGPMLGGYPILGVIGYILAFLIGLFSVIILWPRKRK